MLKNFAFIYFCIDFVLIVICACFGAIHVLNSQIALICSSLIIIASFIGYKNKIQKQAILLNSKDINDVDEFFDEDDEKDKNENQTKNNTNTAKIPFRMYEFASLFAPLRMLAYVIFILAFFYLLKQDLFRVFSFLAGISIMPISALFLGLLNRNLTTK